MSLKTAHPLRGVYCPAAHPCNRLNRSVQRSTVQSKFVNQIEITSDIYGAIVSSQHVAILLPT